MIYALSDSGTITAYSRSVDRLKDFAERDALRYEFEMVEWREDGRHIVGKLGRFMYAFEIYPITLLEGE